MPNRIIEVYVGNRSAMFPVGTIQYGLGKAWVVYDHYGNEDTDESVEICLELKES